MCPWGLASAGLRNVCGRDWQLAIGQKKEKFMPILLSSFGCVVVVVVGVLFCLLCFFFLCSVVCFLSPLQKSLCHIPWALAFSTALTLTLCLKPPSSLYTKSASLGARDMIKPTVLCPHLSQQLACRLWGGWQSRHQLCSHSSPPLCT